MQRIVIEEFSQISEDDALSKAMVRAYDYFSEHFNVAVNVLDLAECSDGRFHAIVEVTITPIKLSEAHEVEGLDLEVRHEHDKSYDADKQKEEAEWRELIHSHFTAMGMAYAPHIPASLKANINRIDLFNMMLEKDFLHSANPKHDVLHKYLPRGYNPHYRLRPKGEDD